MEEFKLSKSELHFIYKILILAQVEIQMTEDEEEYCEKLYNKIWNEIN